jgi:hypothetical protein
MVFAAVMALVIVAVGFAVAAPRVDAGSTGLVQTPTADTVGAGVINIAVDYAVAEALGYDYTIYPARLTYGLGKAELGVSYGQAMFDVSFPDVTVWTYSGKFQLLSETETRPSFAIGADYTTMDTDFFFPEDAKQLSIYAVATKTLTAPDAEGPVCVGNLGLSYDKYQDWFFAYGSDETFLSPFIGLSVRNGGTCLDLEYKWANNKFGYPYAYGIASAALRQKLSGNLSAQIGVTNRRALSNHPKFFGGLALSFGGN